MRIYAESDFNKLQKLKIINKVTLQEYIHQYKILQTKFKAMIAFFIHFSFGFQKFI